MSGWSGLAGTCRACGEPGLEGAEFGSACPRCAGSPLCDNCGHARRKHSGVFGGGPAGCRARTYEVASLHVEPCACPGFVERTRDFAEAGFVRAPEPPDDLPPLRLA